MLLRRAERGNWRRRTRTAGCRCTPPRVQQSVEVMWVLLEAGRAGQLAAEDVCGKTGLGASLLQPLFV